MVDAIDEVRETLRADGPDDILAEKISLDQDAFGLAQEWLAEAEANPPAARPETEAE